MIEKWKLALKEFLKEYEEDEMVVGAILCGSYATGNYDDSSDINVRLILKDSCNFQEKGNKECNSYLIEYLISPKYKIEQSFKEEHENFERINANMFAYGKVIYDLDGSVKILQDLALEYIDKPFDVITTDELQTNNYHIWDLKDELKVSLNEQRKDFSLIYYRLLTTVYDAYCKYQGLAKLPDTKILKILTNEEFRKKYHVFKIPSEEFISLYIKCFNEVKPTIMYKNISNLVNYYYEVQGGFNIRTFKQEIILKEEE